MGLIRLADKDLVQRVVRGDGAAFNVLVARWEKKLGSNHPEVAAALKDWASMLREAKRNSAAKEIEHRVQSIQAARRQEQKGVHSLGFRQ